MRLFIILIIVIPFFSGCGGSSKSGNTDTATSGTITIAADESLRPIIEAEAEVFESIYKDAHLDIRYMSEYDAMQMLVNDSARIAITTRELLPVEKAAFDKVKITPRYSPFAYDAIAIIVNKSIRDTVLTLEQLHHILDGSYSTWKNINSKNQSSPLQVVFDSPKSGAIRYLRDSVLNGKELAKHCFAVENNTAVIDYVEKNHNSIGVIGVNWISDRDDSIMHGFLNRITVVELVPRDPGTAEAKSMKPYQAYIGLKQYPLWRKVQIISREARVGLGTGFASFVASDKGQRIILKSGLVPATAPIRIVEIK